MEATTILTRGAGQPGRGRKRCGEAMTVAVLFARADSHCKALDGVDLWDIQHDGRSWTGGTPLAVFDALVWCVN